MDLMIKDLPPDVERKIKALHILTDGKVNLNILFSSAITEKLDRALLEQIQPGGIAGYTPAGAPVPAWTPPPPAWGPTPPPEEEPWNRPQAPTRAWAPPVQPTASLSEQVLAGKAHPAELYQQVNPAKPKRVTAPAEQQPDPSDFTDGLGDETDEYEQPPEELDPVEDGPEPPADEDDNEVAGSGDAEFDDLVQPPDDLEDDDSLYADASASYGKQAQKKAPAYASINGPKAEDLGLPDLGSDTASMGFFDAQLSGGNLPAYARADVATRRRPHADRTGEHVRPASLPAGEDLHPSSARRRPRVKISGAK